MGLASGCSAGWLNPSQPGFVIQTYTTYQPISGNNTGTISTNGNSYQFAGDNSGWVFIGGPGAQFRGKNEGTVYLDGEGGYVMGAFGPLAVVTNRGKGSLLLGNLAGGQKAVITDVAHGSLLLGAGVVSNAQAIVVGDGNVSHGAKSVTAGSFWATGLGFFGNGGGLTDLREFDTNALAAVVAHEGMSVGAHGATIERYVATNGTHVSPFTSWATAATNIQSAVDVARAGETVWVGNGVYATGSRVGDPMLPGVLWRLVITNAVTVRSVNGPGSALIRGAADVGGVYMEGAAWLMGLTVTNGSTSYAGGVWGGSLSNCVLAGNAGELAGGVFEATLHHCTLVGNASAAGSGAARGCTLHNCVLARNVADNAAVMFSALFNCTLVDNTGDAGSLHGSPAYNCILAGNANDSGGGVSSICWMPARFREGEWVPEEGVNPLFVDYANGNYRLQANSPCINGGTNGAWTVGAADYDGERRIYPIGGRVDIGAFEYRGDAEAVHKSDSVVTAALAFALGTNGQFMIRGGTQLVFVAGMVTNVLDSDVGTP
jgi:hypothetical protein